MTAPLPKPIRTQLENAVKAARDVAEQAARAALAQLAVAEAKAPDYLTDDLEALRRRLRAHGRALGDTKHTNDAQGTQRLVWEVAYEHWHRMLFARFLAENGLLMWEPGASVSLDDCRDMVDQHPDPALGAKSQWELAGKLAARMLPHVFKPRSPVFEISFAPEHQRALEHLLAKLPTEVFQASDSLGWVYQFWQAKRKDEVNASEVKIGADELPAVTQLFTEPYMVDFRLHNSLGAWWMTRHPDTPCPVPLPYLRTLPSPTPLDGEGRGEGKQIPAAGRFDGWPSTLADFKLLDPCCGSGHFLVAAFLRQELRLLHASFARAPLLGSLLDPARSLKDDLLTSSFDNLKELLERALATETPATLRGPGQALNDDARGQALTAHGLLDAARLLDARYHLVITNVPYMARGKQNDPLKAYCAKQYPEAKNDLANVFLECCLELTTPPSPVSLPSPSGRGAGGEGAGVVQIGWKGVGGLKEPGRFRRNGMMSISRGDAV